MNIIEQNGQLLHYVYYLILCTLITAVEIIKMTVIRGKNRAERTSEMRKRNGAYQWKDWRKAKREEDGGEGEE